MPKGMGYGKGERESGSGKVGFQGKDGSLGDGRQPGGPDGGLGTGQKPTGIVGDPGALKNDVQR